MKVIEEITSKITVNNHTVAQHPRHVDKNQMNGYFDTYLKNGDNK